MSGIAGVLRTDGAPVARDSMQRMLQSMSHRGPDRSGMIVEDSLGLAHCMLCTTPQSRKEIQPFSVEEAGLSITADARIDNRADLIRALGLTHPGGSLGDSALILHAYLKWGEACPGKLAGDFAFAIWDRRRRALFCARDPMGVKCFYYYSSPRLFAFGSEIKAILALPEVPAQLNEIRVLDYLVNLFDDRAGTFYRDIVRLPAAHTLVVSDAGVRLSRYWALNPTRELKLSSDGEYAEAFRASFFEAVRCRIESDFPVISSLSGGLDSSAITGVANKIYASSGRAKPLDTVSLIFPGLPKEDLRYIDERGYIEAVLRSGNYRPHYVHADELTPLKDVKQVQYHLDEAFFAGNLYLHWEMYRVAQSNGCRVFLDGLDGDTTVSHGFEYLADLVLGLRWKTLARELRLMRQNLGLGRKRAVREFCIKPLCPAWVYKLSNRLHGNRGDPRITEDFVAKDFKQRLHLADRVDSLLMAGRSCTRTAREKHWEMLNSPLFSWALEMADKAAAAFGVEPRYPFFDRRLIELCLSLPANQKLGQGWSRWVLRRAMEGVLPAEVQWRPAKGDLSPNFYRKLIEGDRKLLDDTVHSTVLAPYVDLTAMQQAYQRYEAAPLSSHVDSSQLFAAANLAVWLETVRLTA